MTSTLTKLIRFLERFVPEEEKAADLKARLGRYSAGVLAQTPSGLFLADPEDWVVGRSLLQHGSWSGDELERLEPYLTPERRVLVVGAHIGSLAIPIARKVQQVVAIEANPDTFRLLEWNVRLNGCTNLELHHYAASDQPGYIRFLLSRANSGGSKREPAIKAHMYYYDQPRTIEVAAWPLDDKLAGRTFDLALMDIEGSEYFALRGMASILQNLRAIQIEYLPHHLKNVAGISPAQFTALLTPHFHHLTIPSLGLQVAQPDFERVLTEMFDRNQEDGGILFEK